MTKIVEEVLPPKRVFPYPFKNNNPLTAGVRELLFVTVLGVHDVFFMPGKKSPGAFIAYWPSINPFFPFIGQFRLCFNELY